jgi:hypothetical protein
MFDCEWNKQRAFVLRPGFSALSSRRFPQTAAHIRTSGCLRFCWASPIHTYSERLSDKLGGPDASGGMLRPDMQAKTAMVMAMLKRDNSTVVSKSIVPGHYDDGDYPEPGRQARPSYRILTMAVTFLICWIHWSLAAGLLLFFLDSDHPLMNYTWIAYHCVGNLGGLCGFFGAYIVSFVLLSFRLAPRR